MTTTTSSLTATRSADPWLAPQTILSFDVEEHHRIEAAVDIDVPGPSKSEYAARMEQTTRWILEELAKHQTRATFYFVGQIARSHPTLVRDVHNAGHEVGSHSWEHRRIHTHTPRTFREDTRLSKDTLEQATGAAVVGYRAPTFSVVRETAWAIDVLGELGFRYDSSIYPVRHDRYGIPDAPRTPFVARAKSGFMLELPILTMRSAGLNIPIGGGGYFRLFPLLLLEHALKKSARSDPPSVSMLYFHPWEFDPDQPRLALKRLSRWRTYIGIRRSRKKLSKLLQRHRFSRACDVAAVLSKQLDKLPEFSLAESS